MLINYQLNPSVLIIEDNQELLTMLSYNLKRHGFMVHTTSEPSKALEFAEEKKPNLIVIESALPNLAGIRLLSSLRTNETTKKTPIIMLTSQDVEMPHISKEEGGADEYIDMPIAPNELVSRIKRAFRRTRPSTITSRVLEFDDLRMNLASYKVMRGNKEVRLGPTEFKILQSLLENPKQVLSREQIMMQVWGRKNSIEPRTIDVHINRLRNALRSHPDEPPLIETIRSSGYCLRRLLHQEERRREYQVTEG